MRRITAALAGLIAAIILAGCQLLSPPMRLDATSPEPTTGVTPEAQESPAEPPPSDANAPDESPRLQPSPTIEIPPPLY